MTADSNTSKPVPIAPTYVGMKSDPRFTEAWLEHAIAEDPALLGLGDLEVIDTQVAVPGGGRLDILLRDPESLTRYEVELQLGTLDESHIVRAIEYWDIERRRFPHYDHIAVIVAEDVSQRFHNVIQLIGESVPLIAIEVRLIETSDQLLLAATQIVKRLERGLEEIDSSPPADRSQWVQRVGLGPVAMVDHLLEMINGLNLAAGDAFALKYNKHYIGLSLNGVARNMVTAKPVKSGHMIAEFKFPDDPDLRDDLVAAGLDPMSYDKTFNNFRVRLRPPDFNQHMEPLEQLIRRAHAHYFGTSEAVTDVD
ncbi:MAG: hypothetical protein OXS30_11865 [Chloroflexota bacterium]|nr:hypothetical protein [Chloroflexota bacterium]